MPRPQRLDYPGAWHHVMHRGARRAPIFRDDADAALFFDSLQEAVDRFRIEVHAYSLMPNHYHLLVLSPFATLSRAMRHVNGVFTQRLNQRERWDGPVFRGRFSSQLVENDAYLEALLAYLHLNPVRAHLVHRPDDECWTSHRAYLGLEKVPPWLTVEEMLRRLGGPEAVHRYVGEVHDGSKEWPAGFALETGWIASDNVRTTARDGDLGKRATLGAQAVLERVESLTRASREQILSPARGPGANAARRFAVWALRRSTLLSQAEIGRTLGMSAPHVATLLARLGRKTPEPLVAWMSAWNLMAAGDGEGDMSSV